MFFSVLFFFYNKFIFRLVILNVIEFDLDIQDVSSRRCRSNKILFSLNENLAASYGMFKEIWLFRGLCCWCRATDAWTLVSTRSWCWQCVPFSHQFCRTAAWGYRDLLGPWVPSGQVSTTLPIPVGISEVFSPSQLFQNLAAFPCLTTSLIFSPHYSLPLQEHPSLLCAASCGYPKISDINFYAFQVTFFSLVNCKSCFKLCDVSISNIKFHPISVALAYDCYCSPSACLCI